MNRKEKKKSEGLTLVSAVGGGIAGWFITIGLSIMADTPMTNLYGISILLGVIVGLLWDIADKLNKGSYNDR
ncbi:hypothetical protein [Ornithinibacillus scapharcae]|uniref:hypothetical protein n=1 Tax=Ornithinibacillus scapharcae TaxID=1147159 RepID=UPI000225ADD6|nr:hypothetical protein [Ornithinibacillus scapharcae]